MSKEKDANWQDERVSQTYKGLATERAPAALNQAVLDEARRSLRQKHAGQGMFSPWTRPLAWAATVGLSLAIVLDVTRLTSDPAIEPMPSEESIRDNFVPKNSDVLEDAREQAKLRFGPSRQSAEPATEAVLTPDDAAASATQQRKAEAEQPVPVVSDSEVAESEVKESARLAEQLPPALTAKMPAAPGSDSESTAETEKDAQRRDDFAARSRQERQHLAPSGFAITQSQGLAMDADSDTSIACDLKVRESRDDWLACIADLRLNGLEEVADREYAEFISQYPDE